MFHNNNFYFNSGQAHMSLDKPICLCTSPYVSVRHFVLKFGQFMVFDINGSNDLLLPKNPIPKGRGGGRGGGERTSISWDVGACRTF